jgi:hypothetical protein
MTDQSNVYTIIAIITPGILQMLMDSRQIEAIKAASLLYNSKLYRMLEDENTRLWRLSHTVLFDLLEEELTTGSIANWPEEQG